MCTTRKIDLDGVDRVCQLKTKRKFTEERGLPSEGTEESDPVQGVIRKNIVGHEKYVP